MSTSSEEARGQRLRESCSCNGTRAEMELCVTTRSWRKRGQEQRSSRPSVSPLMVAAPLPTVSYRVMRTRIKRSLRREVADSAKIKARRWSVSSCRRRLVTLSHTHRFLNAPAAPRTRLSSPLPLPDSPLSANRANEEELLFTILSSSSILHLTFNSCPTPTL